MTFPSILKTKLAVPPAHRRLVWRQRLMSMLDQSLDRKLTLVSAPAGFGKTSLLAHWVRAGSFVSVWLSLDGHDNYTSFWHHLLHGLVGTVPGLESVMDRFPPKPGHGIEPILIATLNRLGDLDHDLVLILDDFHLLAPEAVHPSFEFFLENLPHQVHIYLSSRTDPWLPLARLRANGRLGEIRAADLQFDDGETECFLKNMKLNLDSENCRKLRVKTEGWAAGLQLAALSLHGRSNPERWIDRLTGHNRFIADYLVEEVFARQEKEVQTFLLKTSLLRSMCAGLCDHITGEQNGARMLGYLVRANLFITPLDHRCRFYRYHHLFADALRFHLSHLNLETNVLHRKAYSWYLEQDQYDEAFHHALAAGDPRQAAEILEHMIGQNLCHSDQEKFRTQLEQLPTCIRETRPHLLVHQACLFTYQFQFSQVDRLLAKLGQHLPDLADSREEAEQRTLRTRVIALKAWRARIEGDLDQAIGWSKQILTLEDGLTGNDRLRILTNLALCTLLNGDLKQARKYYRRSYRFSKETGSMFYRCHNGYILAFIEYVRGNLHRAESILRAEEQDLKEERTDQAMPPVYGALLIGLGTVYGDRNLLDEAIASLLAGIEWVKKGSLPLFLSLGYASLAKLIMAKGDEEQALAMMDRAVAAFPFNPSQTFLLRTPAYRASLWVRAGKLHLARQWISAREFREEPIPFIGELDYLVYARFLIADHRPEEADALLRRMCRSAESGQRSGRLIEMLLCRVLAQLQLDDRKTAGHLLGRALVLAQAGGWRRLFLDESPHIQTLLTFLIKQNSLPPPVQRFAQEIARMMVEEGMEDTSEVKGPQPELPWAYRVDPLSVRELEVLTHMARGRTNQEIADQLFISLNTVRTHSKRIHAKLEVKNRGTAVFKARRLGLIE